MAWHLTSDIAEFEDAAGEFLRAEPVRNTVLLTVVASLKASGATAYGDTPPSFGWYEDSEVSAAFLRTPPMPALVTDAPRHAARSLVEVLERPSGKVAAKVSWLAKSEVGAEGDQWVLVDHGSSRVAAGV